MTETKKVFRWWWPWQTDKVESYLEGMASQGWVLMNAGANCTSFTFYKGDPAKQRYCVDFQDKEKPEYLALLADDGWKLEYRGSGWYLWSKRYEGDRPEIYTDRESLARRNSGILASLTAVLAAQIPIGVAILDDLADKSTFAIALLILWGVVVSLLAGVTIGMALGVGRFGKRKASNNR